MKRNWIVLLIVLSFSSLVSNDEFKIKRENGFNFKSEPTVTNEDQKIKIMFETESFCDVTIVVEDDNGKIIRHLVSGVLGDKAPEPLLPKTKTQVIYWDYKNDAGEYVVNSDKINVRVSLGLKPQFERTLFWSPEKRINRELPTLIQSCSKGVLTFEGEGRDQLKLYSHSGEYIKTIYPFSNKDINKIKALTFKEFPQDGKSLPLKFGNKHFSTFLKTGNNYIEMNKYLMAASAIVTYGDKIGVIGQNMGFLTLGNDFENITVEGPITAVKSKPDQKTGNILPKSAALSPDGKWVYLAAYPGKNFVQKIAFQKDGVLECFLGDPDGKRGAGDKENEFDGVASVACDAKGRVYVADYCNNRVQVFSEKGEFLKSIKVNAPNILQIDPNNGDIYVASWLTIYSNYAKDGVEPILTHMGNFDNPIIKSSFPLQLVNYAKQTSMNETWWVYNFHIDFFEKQPIFWLLPGRVGTNSEKWIGRGLKVTSAELNCMKLMVEDGKSLKIIADFGPRITASVKRFVPPLVARQRLYVNPKNEKLYIAEGDSGVMKSFMELVEIDPLTSNINIIKIPVTSEDLCFDHNGLVYF